MGQDGRIRGVEAVQRAVKTNWRARVSEIIKSKSGSNDCSMIWVEIKTTQSGRLRGYSTVSPFSMMRTGSAFFTKPNQCASFSKLAVFKTKAGVKQIKFR